ncbi:hypothetical protein [Kribbella sp. ALI-6-A]|uniref:hypothetical protein n=1 Tax=Kribbella sp. ALI-6-A TaxID=1933817 RepID=UPI001179B8A2|nr:hypothetical protein [Kribbella sp. ALI-6-A]
MFLLGSDAPTLRNYISQSLWTTTAGDRIRGRVPYIDPNATDLDDLNAYMEIQSQVMAWLGDADNYVPLQAEALARSTLSFDAGDSSEKQAVVSLIDRALSDLERDGFALAASPYRLTERGATARLTGLSPASAARVSEAVALGADSWMQDLAGLRTLDPGMAAQIAQLVFEASEVIQHSLWFRREAGSSQAGKLSTMLRFNSESRHRRTESDTFAADIALFSSWIAGDSYMQLANKAPIFKNANSLFGGSNETKRTSDAAEYVGKLTYPAAWVWSGAVIVGKEHGLDIPAFVKSSIEYGVQSEAAAQLITRGHLTRGGAVFVARECGDEWENVSDQIGDEAQLELFSSGLTSLDYERLRDLGERLRLSVQ